MNTESDRMIYEESSVTDNQGLVSKIIRIFICEFQTQFFTDNVFFHWKTVKSENSEKDQREYLEAYASLRLSLALEIIKIYKDKNFDTRFFQKIKYFSN